MTALTNVVRDMLDGRENDEQITVEVSLLWSLVYEVEAHHIDAETLGEAVHEALCRRNVPLHSDKATHAGAAILAALREPDECRHVNGDRVVAGVRLCRDCDAALRATP